MSIENKIVCVYNFFLNSCSSVSLSLSIVRCATAVSWTSQQLVRSRQNTCSTQ